MDQNNLILCNTFLTYIPLNFVSIEIRIEMKSVSFTLKYQNILSPYKIRIVLLFSSNSPRGNKQLKRKACFSS